MEAIVRSGSPRTRLEAWQSGLCRGLNYALRKAVINRLPPKTMLWSRLPDVLSTKVRGDVGLDVGCGTGSLLPFRQLRWYGVDVFAPALERAAEKGVYQGLLCANILNLSRTFRPKSVDTIVALDLVEHLQRPDAERLLDQMETIARQRVIVVTPNGWVTQDRQVVSANPWMEHHCAWTASEFADRGYHVMGWSGWKVLAGPNGYVRRNLDALFQLLMTVSQPFVQRHPRHSFHLFAWKDLSA